MPVQVHDFFQSHDVSDDVEGITNHRYSDDADPIPLTLMQGEDSVWLSNYGARRLAQFIANETGETFEPSTRVRSLENVASPVAG
jgi:hypothetical protein